ncbi:MAG: nucleotidyltransferase family protein [Solobacterium sp.]|nr:nucleotidyltransferase family protein [Solobacterium sp.]
MKEEERYYIRLLSDYVHQRESETPGQTAEWDKIAGYAKEQNTAGIIWYQIKDMDIPEQVREELKSGFMSDVYLSVNSEYALEEIKALFDNRQIDCMPFKGTLIKDSYPHPELRTMGDRDILIRHEDRKKSDEVMMSLGYSKFVDNHAVWTYCRKHLMFEIHDVMFYEELSNQTDYREYFKSIWDSAERKEGCCYIPDRNKHFIYMMVHTAKHVTNKGMGFRAFLDMVFFSINEKADWNMITEELKKLELYEFACICFSLCEYWFDVKMPFHKETPDKEFMEYVTEKMFRDGIFGLTNKENTEGNSAKQIRRSEHGYTQTAIKMTVKKLFPPYRDMQLIPWYRWVDGKPWLMPAAWVYRWGYCIKNKGRESRALLAEPFRRRKEIEEREKYLEHWGL